PNAIVPQPKGANGTRFAGGKSESPTITNTTSAAILMMTNALLLVAVSLMPMTSNAESARINSAPITSTVVFDGSRLQNAHHGPACSQCAVCAHSGRLTCQIDLAAPCTDEENAAATGAALTAYSRM